MTEYQQTEYISLRNDLLFHMVFTKNKEALKGLLSVLLNIPKKEILDPEVLNPMQYSDAIDTKLTVLDLKVHLNGGRYVLVEMQVRKFEYWTNRSVVYTCRQVADQAEDDFDYGKLEPVIQISIMDYTLFPDHRVFFDQYMPRNKEGYPFTDKIQFYVMDLTAMDQATEEQRAQGLIEWGRAFKAESWEEVNEIENPEVKEAAKTMEMIMSNPTQREWIRMRRDAEIDRRTEIRAAERNAHIKDAKGFKEKGVDPAVIASVTGLTLQEIAEL